MSSAPSQIQPPSDPAQAAINALREEIDQVDRELMSLLNQRARLALDIGRLKKNAGLPVFVPERECDLLDKLAQGNHGPLPNRYLVNVFREVISACRSVQHVRGSRIERERKECADTGRLFQPGDKRQLGKGSGRLRL